MAPKHSVLFLRRKPYDWIDFLLNSCFSRIGLTPITNDPKGKNYWTF